MIYIDNIAGMLFAYNQVKRAELPRPFKIPGGLPVAIILALSPLGCTMANVYFALSDDYTPVKSIPYFKVFMFEVFLGTGIIVNFLFVRREKIKAYIKQLLERRGTYEGLDTSTASSPDYSEIDDGISMKTRRLSEGPRKKWQTPGEESTL